VRIALGASRRRIARQFVTESLVLSVTGGLIGLTLALLGVPAIVRHLPADLPRAAEIAVGWRVLVFTSLLSIVTGILFGLVPLRQSRGVSANDSLKSGGRTVTADQSRIRSVLIVGQVAVAIVLLTSRA
jgi:ABC-type antimicrobial peptide transport system permease subunit